MKLELPTLVQNSLLKETRETRLSCDDSLLTKLKVMGSNYSTRLPAFIFVVIYEMKTLICKNHFAFMKGALGAPLEHLAMRQKYTSVHFLCLGSLFDVQVTGGVSCDRFDVELLDFIVTSMPTRGAVSHFSHLNNAVSLRYLFYEHPSLNTCFHIPADYHTIFVGGGLCSNITTAPTFSVNTPRRHQMAGNQPSSTREA